VNSVGNSLEFICAKKHSRTSKYLWTSKEVIQSLKNLGFRLRYDSKILSRSFFFVVKSATISLTCAIMVPNSEAAQRKRKVQKTWLQRFSYGRIIMQQKVHSQTLSPPDVA
jgi:hypothetical protein